MLGWPLISHILIRFLYVCRLLFRIPSVIIGNVYNFLQNSITVPCPLQISAMDVVECLLQVYKMLGLHTMACSKSNSSMVRFVYSSSSSSDTVSTHIFQYNTPGLF